MAGELPTGHPCHQLSNPSAQLFWCRHCMTGFPDPMQRWRHSKECKEIATQKKYGGYSQPNQPVHPLAKGDSPTHPPQADSPTSNKKKKAMDLRCYICRKEFVTINEMRDHVKRPCNKPEVKTPSISEDSDDGSPQTEEKVTNQIEALLKAAHAEIMQKKKKNQLKQLYPQTQNGEKIDVFDPDDSGSDRSQLTMLDLVKRSKNERSKNEKMQNLSTEIGSDFQALSSAEKMGEAMKIYDFISDTPESSPCRPDQSPFQHGESPCQQDKSHGQETKSIILEQSSSVGHEVSPQQPPFDMTSPQHEGNESEDGTPESVNKTYVSSIHPQTEDSNKIPKITLKLVSGEKPKAEVWGIGAALPKRIRKRKSKDFFEDVPIKKTKKKEMTLKEMQEKLLKSKSKGKLKITNKVKVGTKLKLKVVSDSNVVTNTEEKENKMSSDENENKVKDSKPEEARTTEIKAKKKEARSTRTGKSRRIVGKKNLVVVLTDCLNEKDSSSGSKKQNKTAKNIKKTVNGKQKSIATRTKNEASKTKKDNSRDKMSSNLGKTKSGQKSSGKVADKKNDKAKGSNSKTKHAKQKPVAKHKTVNVKKGASDKPVKCKACERTFKTRDLLIKHNQVPCRMRTTRTTTQIILRPKKNGSHVLPLTQRQINAAKRRKQIAGKLSILDHSVKKESLPTPQPEKTEKPEKPKKPPRNRKRLLSTFFTFCISRKEKHPAYEINYDSLSEKDKYFYKLGMYNVVLDKSDSDTRTCEEPEKSVISEEMKPCEITIDQNAEVQSLPSFPSIGSEVSPPILEKMSELQKDNENVLEETPVTSAADKECLDPPVLFTAVGVTKSQSLLKSSSPRRTMSLLKNSPYRSPSAKGSPLLSPSGKNSPYHSLSTKNSPYHSPSVSKLTPSLSISPLGHSPCPSPTPSNCSSVSDSEIVMTYNSESVLSPTITNGAYASIDKGSSPADIDDHFIFNDLENANDLHDLENANDLHDLDNDKENKYIYEQLKLRTKDIGVCCDGEQILREMENCKQFDGFSFGLKVIRPSEKLQDISKDIDISALSEQTASDVNFGTNRKLTYTVTRCVQTESSFLMSSTKPHICEEKKSIHVKNHEKSDEKRNEKVKSSSKKTLTKDSVKDLLEFDFRKVKKVLETDKQQKIQQKDNKSVKTSLENVENGNDLVQDGVPSNKKSLENEDRNLFHSIADLISGSGEKTAQETLFESLLPSTKVTFEDIIEMEASQKPRNFEKPIDPSEKSSITEVEIVLPKGSKVAQLCTDIDWLESADLRPVKTVPTKKEKNVVLPEPKELVPNRFNAEIGKPCLDHDSFLNKMIPNFSEKYKHLCDINVGSVPNTAQKEVKEKPKEIYIYPTKPVVTEIQNVSVTKPLPSKVDAELNAQSSNNLLDLIAKTMGRIPDAAKEKFEKSVMSLLSSATQQAEVEVKMENHSNVGQKGSPVVIMNNNADSGTFSSDIVVFDDPETVSNSLPERYTNDRVMKPSNYCLPRTVDKKEITPMTETRSFVENLDKDMKSFNDTKSPVVISPWKSAIDEKLSNISAPSDISGNILCTGIQLSSGTSCVCTGIPLSSSTSSVADSIFVSSSSHSVDMKFTTSNRTSDLKFLSVSSISPEVKYTNPHSTDLRMVSSGNNLSVLSDSLAMRRKSPKPLNIISNSPTRTSILNHGNKDDIVTIMSDQDSPTFITNFDFENYADSLKEETFFTTRPLSPLQPVSLTPSCDPSTNSQIQESKKTSKDLPSSIPTPVSTNIANQKPELCLKPLAIDCNQSTENEDYICDISPPLEGPVPNISPMDLAKVATAKMTNPLILKSQGLGQGLLQLSANDPMHSPNMFIPQGNPQFYVSPKDFTSVEQRKTSPTVSNARNIQTSPIVTKNWSATSPTVSKGWSSTSPVVTKGWSSNSPALSKNWSSNSPVLSKSWSTSPVISKSWSSNSPVGTKSWSPFSESSSPIQVIDVHLNSFKSPQQEKSNVRDQRYSDKTGMDLRQNVIVSPPCSKNASSANKDAKQKLSKQKHLHNVGILRNSKLQDKKTNVTGKPNIPGPNQHSGLLNNLMQQVTSTSNSNTFLSNSMEQPMDILELVDKSWEEQLNLMQNNQPKSSNSFTPVSLEKTFDQSFSSSQISKASTVHHHSIGSEHNKSLDNIVQHKLSQDGFLLNSRVSDSDKQFLQMHPKFAHHKQLQLKTLNKVPCENSKSSTLNSKPSNMNLAPGHSLSNTRLSCEQPEPQCEHASRTTQRTNSLSDQGQTMQSSKSKCEPPASKPQFEHISRTSHGNVLVRTQSDQFSDKRNLESFQQVHARQQQVMFNSHLSPENTSQIRQLTGVQRSQSFDQTPHRNTIRYPNLPEKSVINSPPVNYNPQQDVPKDRIFNFQANRQPTPLCGQGLSPLSVGLRGQVPPLHRPMQPNLAPAGLPFGAEVHNHSNSAHIPVLRQMSAPSTLNHKPQSTQNIVPEYEDVSSPEEVEVYPSTPKKKDPPPYRMQGETLSIHSVAKGQSSHLGIPDNFDLKSSLNPKVQYPGQPTMVNPGLRGFTEQRPPPPVTFFPPGPQHHLRKPFDPSLPFPEFCPSNISDSILDNL